MNGTKGQDKRKIDSATGRSNALGKKVQSWKEHAVRLPGQSVEAVCDTPGCKAKKLLEYVDSKDRSTPVAFVHLLPGKRGKDARCRGVGGSHGVYRPKDGSKSITSGALLKRAQRAKKRVIKKK